MAGGGIKINNNSIRGGADGITYTPRIGADGLLYFDPNRRGYNSIGGFVIKGEDGRDGVDGLPGRDGAKGEKGATGAKLVAMVPDPANTGDGNKYTMYFDDGTVAEFVAPRGEKGDQGEKGEKGDPGEKGEKGADGKDAEIAPTLEGNDPDKAPSVQAVNEGLSGKLDIMPSTGNKVYAQQEGKPKFLGYANVNVVDNVVLYGRANDGKTDFGGFLQTTTPVNPYNCANKKYVDEEIAKMEALLGETIKIVEVQGNETGWGVPEGALPNFYFPSTEVEYPTGDNYENPETATTHINTLYFYDGNGGLLGSEAAISGTYYVMPSGTVRIGNDFDKQMGSLDPPYNYMPAKPCKLTFMIKVGV